MAFERSGIEIDAIRREAVLPVDREQAWTALCDAEGLAGWLADEVELEVREGASGTLRWRSGETRTAIVEEVQELRRLSLRWRDGEQDESLVELILDDVPGGTRIVVVEVPIVALRVAAISLEQGSSAGAGPRMLAALA
jgi:uncharacterized protein YndB with AHSA1/START domain